MADHDHLIKKRKQELKDAQDVKELYQKKLERVNDLFMELETWKLQLDERQVKLDRKEKQLSIQSSKVYYKKKLKPLMISKAHERLQKRSFKSPNSTTPDGGRSTSPESPFKLPPPASPTAAAAVLTQPSYLPSSPSRIGAAAVAASSLVDSTCQYSNRPQVRVNPLYLQQQQQLLDPAASEDVIDVGSSKIHRDASRAAPTFSSTTPKCSTTSHSSKARLRVRFCMHRFLFVWHK